LPDDNYYHSYPGQFFVGACDYFLAARTLWQSEHWGRRLLKPTTNLISQGLELLLKFPLLEAGASIDDVRRMFGHDLQKLWDESRNTAIRELVLRCARESWAKASQSDEWKDSDFSRDPEDVFMEAVHNLSNLHGSESDYALRYFAEVGTEVPRAPFLIEALCEATRLVRIELESAIIEGRPLFKSA
jgi:hypothetical protein